MKRTRKKNTTEKKERWFDQYIVQVPEGISGDWKIERFEIDAAGAAFHNLRERIHGGCRDVVPGIFTRLTYQGDVIMSDTPAEIRDHLVPIKLASGRCLVNGLGLGMVVRAMLEKPEVEHVTVVDLSKDVIELVGGYYHGLYGDRLTIINDDAFTWKPSRGDKFEVIWHDIWPNICSSNLAEMVKLERRYVRCCGWQGCWCENECRMIQ